MDTRKSPSAITSRCDFQWLGKCFILSYTMKKMKWGFTLAELLLAAAILAFVLTVMLLFFVNAIILNETNRNFTLAYSAIEAKMEEIKNTDFDNLDALDGTDFDLDGFSTSNGQGRIGVSDEATDLKRIKIVACFKSRNRLIGNDIDDCQSSPAELVTLITR